MPLLLVKIRGPDGQEPQKHSQALIRLHLTTGVESKGANSIETVSRCHEISLFLIN